MSKRWRITAATLFVLAVLGSLFFGQNILAMADDVRTNLQTYTELVELAHAKYAGERAYRDIVFASIGGMLRSLDPHTSFLPPVAYDAMRAKHSSTFYGLGIFVGQRDGQLTVITPIPGTPAFRQGMRAGDVIFAIDGEPTSKMSIDDAIGKLKGPKDTEVLVTIVRPGLTEPLDISIRRAEIPQTTVQYAFMLEPGTGYINIRDFSQSTGGEVERALADLRHQGLQRLILDLRNNGGGLLDQAIAVADQFVPLNSKIVETRGRIPSSYESFGSSGNRQPLDLPLIVLVNGGSASASEIVSGAIQDHDVGLIVGEVTWGKGLVQTVYSLSWNAGLALTTARYYTPSGRLIQRDYTSYWDYYYDRGTNDGSPKKPADDEPVFHTDAGRAVYGGGGITPDVPVAPELLPEFVQKVMSRSGYFRWVIDYTQAHQLTPNWVPNEETMNDFISWTAKEGVVSEEEAAQARSDENVLRHSRHRLQFEAFNGKFGLEAGFKALAPLDTQIQQALGLFDQAGQLLAQRHAVGEPDQVRTAAN